MAQDRRPDTAPDFLLSRPHESVRTQGFRATYPDPFAAATALRSGEANLIVGAIPFDTSLRAALMVPETTIRAEGPLEPPAVYRGKAAATSLQVVDVEAASTAEEHAAAVSAAIATINQTRLEKVVLARAVDVHFEDTIDPLLVAARLIDLSAYRDGFAVDLSVTGREEHAGAMFVGSSPEVLIRKSGANVTAFPLAGSARRTGNEDVDRATARELQRSAKDFHEHKYVVDHYRRVLEPLCSFLEIPDHPQVHQTNEMIHLGTSVRGTLSDPSYSALDLALMLHPTPAIAGMPTDDAIGIIEQVEQPREFYAGAVGWCDAHGDGEYMVAIRCCMVDGDYARAWAGGGIVAASNPEAEAAETTAKLQTALRALNVPAALREI